MTIKVQQWFADVLTRLGTCQTCQHQAYDDACECEEQDCVCFQERQVTHIDCLACGYVPEADEPAIYAHFGTEAYQYRETWQRHVDALHEKSKSPSCVSPQWRVSYTQSH